RAGRDSDYVSPRPHRAADEARRRAGERSVQADWLGRSDRGARVEARWARGSENAGDAGAAAPRPAQRALRRVCQTLRRAVARRLRALFGRGAAARERDQLWPRAAADVRSRAIAVRHRLRRRLPGDVELASGPKRRIWRDASGPTWS